MLKQETRIAQRLVAFEVRFQRNRQVNAIHRALRLIFPLILVGSVADFIDQSWLQAGGYYYQTLHVTKWLLQLRLLRQYLRLISAGTLGVAAMIMAFAVSFYLVVPVTRHTRDQLMAGTTAVISLKFFNVNRQSVLSLRPVQWVSANLGLQGIFMGILIGLLVGNTYRWAHLRQKNDEENLGRTLTVTSLWLLGTTALGLLWITVQTVSVNTAFVSSVRWPFQLPHFILGLVGFSILNSLYEWLGVLGPLAVGGQSIETAQNLASVLNHPGWQVPHPVTLQTVVNVYASFGGTGMLLGLLLAIFLTRATAEQRRIGWFSLLPTIGNFGAPLMTGLPVILSPILGIPFLLAPLACISVSWLCLRLAWVPAVAYPLATGTPGPLLAYLGTSGSWAALLLAVIDLAISVAIYYPFVKLAAVAQEQLQGEATAYALRT